MSERIANRNTLALNAIKFANLPFHGDTDEMGTNLKPIIDLFPRWNLKDANNAWCSAFVYYCLVMTGFEIPYSPKECLTCSLAGCGGFEEFAMFNKEIEYYKAKDNFLPNVGDIVLYDKVFLDKEHDHIGIIVGTNENILIVAEGNIKGTNTSGIIERKIDNHIRAYIRIPNGFKYKYGA